MKGYMKKILVGGGADFTGSHLCLNKFDNGKNKIER